MAVQCPVAVKILNHQNVLLISIIKESRLSFNCEFNLYNQNYILYFPLIQLHVLVLIISLMVGLLRLETHREQQLLTLVTRASLVIPSVLAYQMEHGQAQILFVKVNYA